MGHPRWAGRLIAFPTPANLHLAYKQERKSAHGIINDSHWQAALVKDRAIYFHPLPIKRKMAFAIMRNKKIYGCFITSAG
jgi:hypothetical protein